MQAAAVREQAGSVSQQREYKAANQTAITDSKEPAVSEPVQADEHSSSIQAAHQAATRGINKQNLLQPACGEKREAKTETKAARDQVRSGRAIQKTAVPRQAGVQKAGTREERKAGRELARADRDRRHADRLRWKAAKAAKRQAASEQAAAANKPAVPDQAAAEPAPSEQGTVTCHTNCRHIQFEDCRHK